MLWYYFNFSHIRVIWRFIDALFLSPWLLLAGGLGPE